MALSDYARLRQKRGRPMQDIDDMTKSENGHPVSIYSTAAAAERVGVSAQTLKDAKVVLAEGTADEIAAARDGTASAKKLATNIRTRRPVPYAGFAKPAARRTRESSGDVEKTRLLRELVRIACTSKRHTVKRAGEVLRSKAFKDYQGVDFPARFQALAEWINSIGEELK
jgi:hypothetical protein